MLFTLVDFDKDIELGKAILQIEHLYFQEDGIDDFDEIKVLAVSDMSGLKGYIGYHDEHQAIYTMAVVPHDVRKGYGRALMGILYDMYPTVSWQINLHASEETPGVSKFPHNVSKTFFKQMGFVHETDDCHAEGYVLYRMVPLAMPHVPSIWEAIQLRFKNMYYLGSMLANKYCKSKRYSLAKTKTF
jgi:hypothetical protein